MKNQTITKILNIIFLYDTHQIFCFGSKILCTSFFITTTTKNKESSPWQMTTTLAILLPISKAQASIKWHSAILCVPLHFIDKNTTIDTDFAQKYYQYHQYFDLTMIHKLCFNLPHSQQQPINSYNNDIGRVIQIY